MKNLILFLIQSSNLFLFYFIYFISFYFTTKPIIFSREPLTGFFKPKPKAKESEQKSKPVATSSNTPEDKKKKEEEKKKEEADLKKLIDRLWVASSIAAIIIVTWTIYKHLSK